MNFFYKSIFKFNSIKRKPKAPWSKYYHDGAMDINIPKMSVYNYFENKVLSHGNGYCIDYYGHKIKEEFEIKVE